MKVRELYTKCKELIDNNHGEYDVTIEMEGRKDRRESIDDLYIKSFRSDNIGLLVLKSDYPLQW